MKGRLHVVLALLGCLAAVPEQTRGQMKEGSHCFFRDGTLGACRKTSDCPELNGILKVAPESVRTCSKISPIYCCYKTPAPWPYTARGTRPVHVPKTRQVWSDGSPRVPTQRSYLDRDTSPASTLPANSTAVLNQQPRQIGVGDNVAWVHAPENEGNTNCMTDNHEQGTCTHLYECPELKTMVRKSTQCSNGPSSSLVCCPRTESSTTPTRPRTQTRLSKPRKPAGEKSAKMCELYASYVIQEITSPVLLLNPEKYNVSLCFGRLHAPNQKPLPDAEHAIIKEYPHLAALGYGEKGNIDWLCAGSLISEKFILTTAHCLSSPANANRNVSWVHLGDLGIRNNQYPEFEDIQVAKTYQRGDIALLQLKHNVTISPSIRPACLYSNKGNPPGYTFGTATGWGKYDWDAKPDSDDLKKKDLNFETCAKLGQKVVVSDSTHICVSNPDIDDTSPCVVDSGSPLQVMVDTPHCMNSIVGLATSGKDTCTDDGNIAVYTRVSKHIQWIEDIVWSSK